MTTNSPVNKCPWEWCAPDDSNCPHVEPAMGENVMVETPDAGHKRAIYFGRIRDRYGISAIVDIFDEERMLRAMHPSRIAPFDPKIFHQSNKK